jgi:hypothetical protein
MQLIEMWSKGRMRLAAMVPAIFLAGLALAQTDLRTPSCEALSAIAFGSRGDPVELAFGRPVNTLSVAEFDWAIEIVQGCVDQIEAQPPDEPGLTMRERKLPQLVALRQFMEDLKFYRVAQRERERPPVPVRR